MQRREVGTQWDVHKARDALSCGAASSELAQVLYALQ